MEEFDGKDAHVRERWVKAAMRALLLVGSIGRGTIDVSGVMRKALDDRDIPISLRKVIQLHAEHRLRTLFGLELRKCDAAKGNRYLLMPVEQLSSKPDHLRDIHGCEDESDTKQSGVLLSVLALTMLGGQEGVTLDKLVTEMQAMGVVNDKVTALITKKFVDESFLTKRKRDGVDVYTLGPRAHVEVDMVTLAKFILDTAGMDVSEADVLKLVENVSA